MEEEFEDTKGVIRIRISMKNRQHNGQKKKYKRTNNDLQNIHIKLKIERIKGPKLHNTEISQIWKFYPIFIFHLISMEFFLCIDHDKGFR